MSFLVEYWGYEPDPRTKDWFLISETELGLSIVSFYLFFSKILGPRLMRDRRPFVLKNTLIVYNFGQVLFNTYILYEGLMAGWLYNYSYRCQPMDHSNSPQAMRLARALYTYYISKYFDVLDTVFFVMRKKQRQISFLHVYHHAGMIVFTWLHVRYFSSGHSTFGLFVNAFIHIILYFYYMLTAFGPKIQKYLWWKKHLTLVQIIQFVVVVVHDAQVFVRDCDYPKLIILLNCVLCMNMVYLFGSFYLNKENYKRNLNSKKKREVSDSKENCDIANHTKVDRKID